MIKLSRLLVCLYLSVLVLSVGITEITIPFPDDLCCYQPEEYPTQNMTVELRHGQIIKINLEQDLSEGEEWEIEYDNEDCVFAVLWDIFIPDPEITVPDPALDYDFTVPATCPPDISYT